MTLRRSLRLLFWLPFLILMVAFALSNMEAVEIGLFPTGLTVSLPLSIAVLGGMGIGFFLGGLSAWLPALRHRRAANQARDALHVLEAKHEELKARGPGSLLAPPR